MSVVSVCPNIDLALQHKDVFLKSGDSVTMRQWISTSYSSNQATFSCPPPSLSTFIDRYIVMSVPVTVTITATNSSGPNLLVGDQFALRAYPVSSITNNLQLTVNSQSYSFQTSEIIPGYSHYFKMTHESTFPDYLDKYQNYDDGFGANNNPLAGYAYSVGKYIPRGAYPMVVSSNTKTSAVFSTTIFEPLFIPILHGNEYDQGLGLTNVKTLDINVNFNSALSRILSFVNPDVVNISNIAVGVAISGAPTLYMKYTSPPYGYVPRPLEYACDNVERFVTNAGASLASNASVTIQSSNMQLNAIPTKMLIFCREATNNLTYESSDTATAITAISINFNNMSGLLASASQFDLFNMSKSNGLQDTWEEFNGLTSDLTSQVGTCGSFMMLRFGKDVTVAPGDFPGKVGAYNLQMNVTIKNVNQTTAITNPSLYIVVVTPQKTIIDTGGSVQNIIGIPASAGNSSEYVPFRKLQKHYGGSFSDFISKVGSFFKPVVDVLRNTKLISTVASMIPHPIAQTVGSVASKMGFGEGRKRRVTKAKARKGKGDGGEVMTRDDLLRAIQNAN